MQHLKSKDFFFVLFDRTFESDLSFVSLVILIQVDGGQGGREGESSEYFCKELKDVRGFQSNKFTHNFTHANIQLQKRMALHVLHPSLPFLPSYLILGFVYL